ncbi:MAG: hypothetical protein JSW09_11630 [Pseudomonadota bacterium]|nr:MAG: hypothetical protein JSW09_11630 [Pseudomonadota bacterium]
MNKRADQLARWASYLLVVGLALWASVWATTSLISDDPWMPIAGFFVGLVAFGVFGVIPAIMGFIALRLKTELKGRAFSAMSIGFGMFLLVVLLYAT